MTKLNKLFYKACFIAFLAVAISFIAPGEKLPVNNKLVIQFENYVGNDVLKLDSAVYKNELGQAYTISKLKYYISNIHLKNRNGKDYISPDYFLVNEDEKKSKQLLLSSFPVGEYVSISFMLGVDSLHNCSGAQSGALDPVNGMFWAWNTGYVFLKLEGNSAFSKSTGNIFEYHIGGYQSPHNCIRNINLSFGTDILKSEHAQNCFLEIKTDVSEVFKSPATIDFSKLSSVVDLHNATTIADNYQDMFSIIEIK